MPRTRNKSQPSAQPLFSLIHYSRLAIHCTYGIAGVGVTGVFVGEAKPKNITTLFAPRVESHRSPVASAPTPNGSGSKMSLPKPVLGDSGVPAAVVPPLPAKCENEAPP